ncbi:acetyltransferase-like protein 16 [Elsinoe australis]|uniref:Acetyltransferase-like protein 16 n=1 Tax=Elsinoe australis TaxID=40998 RepID=A0A4U7AX08_9PEZI|nr:acetyltransferase-like protein 16 [Elsinoe australis]
MPSFNVRPASTAKNDGPRLLRNFDSQLAWLAAKGSSEQWGTTSRTNPETLAKYRKKVENSEAGMNQPWTKDSTRAWVVETTVSKGQLDANAAEVLDDDAVEDEGGMVQLPVAAVVIEGKAVDYVSSILPEQDEKDPFVYIHYVLTDRRAGELSRGAGAFALKYAIDRAKELGFKRVCLDCWSGNGGRLIQYYERQGFSRVGDFGAGEGWPGTVMEMRL